MLFQAGANYRTAFEYMRSWGLADAVLPFLLFFALLFAVLQKVHLFGKKGAAEGSWEPDRKMNGVIGFVIAMMIVLPHIVGGIYPEYADPVTIINNILPTSAVIIFAIIMILLIVGMMGKEAPGIAPVSRLAGLAGVIILTIIFLANIFPGLGLNLWFLKEAKFQALAVVIGIFAVVVWFITKPEKKEAEPWTWLHELFGGKT